MNSEEKDWEFWEQPLDSVKSLQAFLAAEAARDQGTVVFSEFVFGMLDAVHARKLPVDEIDTIREVAGGVSGLDVARLLADMNKPKMRERIARDYAVAVEEHGIFGTPTLLFPEGEAVFVKSAPCPEGKAEAVFDTVRNLSQQLSHVRELKKPRRPES